MIVEDENVAQESPQESVLAPALRDLEECASLLEVLERRARDDASRAAHVFIEDGEERAALTYGELERRARSIGALLRRRGACPGDRVLLLHAPGLDLLPALFGCFHAGTAAVVVGPRDRKRDRTRTIVEDCGARLGLSNQPRVLAGEEEPAAGVEWLAEPAGLDEPAPSARPRREDLALLQYTAGSTGTPRGVMVSHGNLLANARLSGLAYGFGPGSCMLSWLPAFHDMGLIGGILQPLLHGFPGYLMSPLEFLQRPLAWVRALSRFRATVSVAPNFAFDLCARRARAEDLHGVDLSRWRVAINGAEPISPETLERFARSFAAYGFRRESFAPSYGLAEATLTVSGGVRERAPTVRQRETRERRSFAVVGCGPVLASQDVRIVDPERRVATAPGESGEIWVAGASIARGYWNRPDESEQAFGARTLAGEGPFLRTGDLGFVADGELFVTGRLKDLLIVRGVNHAPHPLEWTAGRCHPALRADACAAFQDGERVVLVQEVQREHLRGLDAGSVLLAIRRAVSDEHGISVHAVALVKPAAIPRTTSGKIRRGACSEAYRAGALEFVARHEAEPEPEPVEPAPRPAEAPDARAIEAWLTARVSARLGLVPEHVRVDEPFARLGLDSLGAANLAEELGAWLGRRLDPTLAYERPTIERVAAHLAATPDVAPLRAAAAAREPGDDAIAVIGMGCRFPGAASPEAFWDLLDSGASRVREIPATRWSAGRYFHPAPGRPGRTSTRWAGLLDDVESFDAEFFGLTAREALHMDPQQRLLLEVAWEALEHAGIAPERLRGTPAGVFVGIGSDDYYQRFFGDPRRVEALTSLGNARSIAANRLSYVLDLRGPSLAIDTACSSSLVAVHQALQSLRSGESDLALAGGVNVLLDPRPAISFSHAGMMSADGRCKAFDARADGYVRGEGCGVLVLKRHRDALRDGDGVLALLRGSAVNQDGRSNGLTAPNGPAQVALVRQALARAGVSAAQVSYVEAHGTGTVLGDRIEYQALVEALGARSEERGRWIGSVKTNIGHLEAAAGVAGLVKVVLALQHGRIPASLNWERFAEGLAGEQPPLVLPASSIAWPSDGGGRVAGVSSFGFGGTNAHVVAAESPREEPRPRESRALHALALSARDARALAELARRYAEHFRARPELDPAEACATANRGRRRFAHRCVAYGADLAALRDELERFAGLPARVAPERAAPLALWIRTPDDSAVVRRGRELLGAQPAFRAAVERCREVLQRPGLLGPEFRVFDPEHRGRAARACDGFAFGYALASAWEAWGVRPALVLGAGVGELAAACFAGALGLEQALALLCANGAPAATPGAARLAWAAAASARAELSADAFADPPASRSDQTNLLARAMARGVPRCEFALDLDPEEGSAASPTANAPAAPCGAGDEVARVRCAGELFLRGFELDWASFDGGREHRRVVLPTYPFQRRRFWPDAFASEGQGARGEGAHPLLGTRVRSAVAPESVVFESRLELGAPVHFEDHRVCGEVTVPLAYFVALGMAALGEASGAPVRVLEDLIVERPLVLDDGERFLQAVVDGERRSGWRVALHAQRGGSEAWTRHVVARGAWAERSGAPTVDLADLRARLARGIETTAHYARLARFGLAYGPAFRRLEGLHLGEGEALGELRAVPADGQAFHPGALDAALQLVGALLPGGEEGRPLVPWRVARAEWAASGGVPRWCRARLRSASEQAASADVELLDAEGTVLVLLEGLELRAPRVGAGREAPRLAERCLEECWVPTPQRAPRSATRSDPLELARAAAPRLAALLGEPAAAGYARAHDSLEELARAYARAAASELGALEPETRGDPAQRAGIAAGRRRLFERVLELARDARGGTPAELAERIRREHPAAAAELALLERCGTRLAAVLRDELDPLEALFPRDDPELAARVYAASAVGRAMNALLAQVLLAVQGRLQARQPLRILEVGAGTGATTRAILAALDLDSLAYSFTDVSPSFVAKARGALGGRALRFETLDLERDPDLQGFRREYDVVVAGNVLHATGDLERTLERLQRVLLPGGLLALVEGTAPVAWLDVTFGLTDGWWAFRDTRVRRAHPLLSEAGWTELLARRFEHVAVLSAAAASGDARLASALFLARAPLAGDLGRPGTWLILSDGKVGDGLEARLAARGKTCRRVHAAAALHVGAELARCDAAAAAGEPPLEGVVHAFGAELERVDDDALPRVVADACAGLGALARALSERDAGSAPRVLVLTRGAVVAGGVSGDAAPVQGPLRALAAVAARELPAFGWQRVDLDPRMLAESLDDLVAGLGAPSDEEQLALRAGGRYVARLVRAPDTGETDAVVVVPEATYAVLGWTSAAGLAAVRWLVERGARHLLLCARAEASAAQRAEAETLAARGVRASLLGTEDVEALRDALARLRAESLPLRGVLVAGAPPQHAGLARASAQALAGELDATASGAWRLQRELARPELDFFVLLATPAALLGSAGLGARAASDAWLAAIARRRHARGERAVCLEWGPAEWLDSDASGGAGVEAVPLAAASEAFDLALRHGGPELALLAVDAEARRSSRYFDLLPVEPARGREPSAAGATLAELRALAPGQRRARLEAFVRAKVAAVLGLASPDDVDPGRGFFELGVDSLTSIDLRQQLEQALGCAIPEPVVFDHPTVRALAAYLEGEIDPALRERQRELRPFVSAGAKGRRAELESLPEDEVARLLGGTLREIQREGRG